MYLKLFLFTYLIYVEDFREDQPERFWWNVKKECPSDQSYLTVKLIAKLSFARNFPTENGLTVFKIALIWILAHEKEIGLNAVKSSCQLSTSK